MRNYLALVAAVLPVLFVVVSLIIEQQIPKPQDSPALLISFDRYQQTQVVYNYNLTDSSSLEFIHSYKSALQSSSKTPTLVDLATSTSGICQDLKPTDVLKYLVCVGERSLLDLNDRHLIGAEVRRNPIVENLHVNGFFNNQPYHAPPLSLNYISNGLLKQFSPPEMQNRTIHVVNHPVDKRILHLISSLI